MAAGKVFLPGGKSELQRVWRWITSSGGNLKESATESRPPSHPEVYKYSSWFEGKGENGGVRAHQFRWRHRKLGKPRQEQDQIGSNLLSEGRCFPHHGTGKVAKGRG